MADSVWLIIVLINVVDRWNGMKLASRLIATKLKDEIRFNINLLIKIW